MTYLFTILPLQTSQGDDSGLIFFALIVFPIWAYFIIYKPIKNKIEDIRIDAKIKREKQIEAQRRKEAEEQRKRYDSMMSEWHREVKSLEDTLFPVEHRDCYGRETRKNIEDDLCVTRFRSELQRLRRVISDKHGLEVASKNTNDFDRYFEKYETREEKNRRVQEAKIREENRRKEEERRRILQQQKEAAERQAELARRRNLAAQFKYITLGGYKAAYCFDYYPKNRFPSVTAQQEADRRAVWNFKDGSYTYGLNRLADFLDGNFTKEEMKKVVVCVIPASTQYKNDIRYKTMCAKIAEKFPVINGYNYITINTDRSDSRTQKSSDTVWNLSFSSSVRGKTVVLFDDITTRGTSFIQVANKLKEAGASNVHGFFLGKTLSY